MTAKLKFVLWGVLVFGTAAALILPYRENARLRAQLKLSRDAGGTPRTSRAAAGAGQNATATGTTVEQVAALARILQAGGKNEIQSMRAVLDFIDQLKPADARRVLDAFSRLPENAATEFAKKMVLARWAETDPAAALAWARSRTLYDGRGAAIATVFETWAAKDPAAALAAVSQVDNPRAREEIYQNIFSRLAAADPAAALATLRSLPAGQQMLSSYGEVFYTWAMQDPKAASLAAQDLPPSLARNQAMQQLASAWAQQDPSAALAWAGGLPTGNSRTDALMSALTSIAKENPQAGTTYLANLPNGPAKNSLMVNFASNWATSDPAAAMAWTNANATGELHDQVLQGILAQMSEADPAKAAAFLSQITLASARELALPQLATAWAQKDIQGAMAWVQSLPRSDADGRNQAIRAVVGTWSLTDPASAAAYVQTIPTDPNFRGMTDLVTQNWANADPQAAFAWAQSLPSAGTGAQANAMRTALTTFANVDPQAAWDLALKATWSRNTQPPLDGNAGIETKTMANIVLAWSTQDGAAAAAHLADFPAGSVVNGAASVVMSNWIKQDPRGASQAIDAMPPSATRDSAIIQLITVEGKNDLPAAFAWANAMSTPAAQYNGYTAVFQEWAKRDPAAASAALKTTNVTDAQRTTLQKVIVDFSQAAALRN